MTNENLEKNFIETGKGKVYYFVKNSAGSNSIPVVFLHGLSSNHTTWIDMMNKLSSDNIKSLALDMRGHGYSDKTRKRKYYQMSVFTEDLEKIINREKLENFILLGYSFSGAVVLDYASTHPEKVKGIILIGANHRSPTRYKHLSWINWPSYFLVNLLGWLLVWQKRKHYYYFEQGKSKSYWDSTLKGFGTMPLSINYWMLSEMLRIDYGHVLKNIACPAMIIRSSGDIFFSLKEMEEMAEKIPNCECHDLKVDSHFLATAHQDKIRNLIMNFIKKICV